MFPARILLFGDWGKAMWGFARYGLASLLIGIAAAKAGEAQPSQRTCWPQKPFQANSALSLVAAAETKTLSVSFNTAALVDVISTAETRGSRKTVRLKEEASGQLTGASDMHLQNGLDYYEVGHTPLRLRLAAQTEVDIAATVTLVNDRIPAGTSATIKLTGNEQLSVELGAAAKLTPSAKFGIDDLRPQLLPSATPPRTIKAKAFKLGAGFAASKSDLSACIFDGTKWEHASIENVNVTEDSADLAIALPDALSWSWKNALAVMLPDGRYAGHGFFRIVPTWVAGAVALLVLLVGHFLIWGLVIWKARTTDDTFAWRNAFKGSLGKFSQAWFSGSNRVPSLSMFQIYIWTWLVIVGLTYVLTITGELFAITPQVLSLLGIAGLGSLAARFVATPSDQRPNSDPPKFSDILKTNKEFDLYKLQMFLFTVYTAGFVGVRIAFDQAFPQLDTNLLLLMGISNGIYVGSKASQGESPYQSAERLDLQLKLLTEAKSTADNEVTRLTTEKTKIEADLALKPNDVDLKLLQAMNKKRLDDADAKAKDLQKQLDDTATARKTAIEKIGK
jgi:hypothetical protein